jgi:hypothetical protein
MTPTRDARALGYARMALGLLFLVRTTPLSFLVGAPFRAQTLPLLGWPTAEWTVAVTGVALPGAVVASLCVLRTMAAVLFTCGVRARWCGIVASVCGYLVLAQDRFAFVNSLHLLFLATFVVALTVAPTPERELVASSVRFVGIFLASIYFWAGIAKVQPEWLSGHALDAQARAGAFAGPLGALVGRAAVRSVASWTIPAVELGVAVLLLLDRRRIAIVAALLFHLVVELTVNPDTLGWQMAVLLVAIWPSAERSIRERAPRATMDPVARDRYASREMAAPRRRMRLLAVAVVVSLVGAAGAAATYGCSEFGAAGDTTDSGAQADAGAGGPDGAPVDGSADGDPGAVSQRPNLLTNGGFESGCGGWDTAGLATGSASVARSGTGACVVCLTGVVNPASFIQHVPAPTLAGQTYKGEIWVRADPEAGTLPGLQLGVIHELGNGTTEPPAFTGGPWAAATWIQMTALVTTHEAGVGVALVVRFENSAFGCYVLDDAALYRTP